MALYTPPSKPGSGQNSNDSQNKGNNSSSSPANSNTRYPNPSFGLSLWGPLVPASDCKQCLCTLATWQLGLGIAFWMIPARHAFNKDFYYTAYEAREYRSPSASPAPTNPTNSAPQSAGVSKNGVKLPPSFTHFNQYNPSSNFHPGAPQYPSNHPTGIPNIAQSIRPPPSSPPKIFWMKCIRVASVIFGAYLIFESGLEYVRLGLTYDPWCEDAAEARRVANEELAKRRGSFSSSPPTVSKWFGPEGYKAIPYKEWRERVDQYFQHSVGLDKGSKFSGFFGGSKPLPRPNGVLKPRDHPNIGLALNILISQRITTRLRAIEVLSQLKNDQNELGDALYSQFTNESGLDYTKTSPNGIGSPSPMNPMFAGSNTKLVPRIAEDPTVDNSPLTKQEEEELEALKPKSPFEIDPVSGILDAWDRANLFASMTFRPMNHYVPTEATVRFIEDETRRKKESDDEVENKVKEILLKEFSKQFGLDFNEEGGSKSDNILKLADDFSNLEWDDEDARKIENISQNMLNSLNWNELERRVGYNLTNEQRGRVEDLVISKFIRAAIASSFAEAEEQGQPRTNGNHSLNELKKAAGLDNSKADNASTEKKEGEKEKQNDDDGYDYYDPSEHKEDEDEDDDDDLKVTFPKPKGKKN